MKTELQSGRMRLKDVSYNVGYALIRYIYCGIVDDVDPNFAWELLVLANL
jgi:hypothetical protein